MRDATFMTLMRLLPKSALSSAVGLAARAPVPRGLHRAAMRVFALRYGVDMGEAEHGFSHYPTFAQFFTRRLKPGLRPIDGGERAIVSPVDGTVSQAGDAEGGRCLQAKGIWFPLDKLLGDEEEAERFAGGTFATLYLSPRDYHRIHAPVDGEIVGYTYLPGQFWPVNPVSVRSKDALFCLNERLVTYIASAAGKVALVAVGATCVARIHAAYDDLLTHAGSPRKSHFYPTPKKLTKGEEVAMFEMGSTVILLFEKGRVRWDTSVVEGAVVRVGGRMGERV
ncbi:MAG: archaetidylserine decarboxylase [Myxococcota bacterium]